MGVDAGTVLVPCEREPNHANPLAVQGQVSCVPAGSVVGEFKSILALPAQTAGVQSNRL